MIDGCGQSYIKTKSVHIQKLISKQQPTFIVDVKTGVTIVRPAADYIIDKHIPHLMLIGECDSLLRVEPLMLVRL